MSVSAEIEQLRKDYTAHTLKMHEVADDPVDQFQQWFEEAMKADVPEPNAMTLSTVGSQGRPSARIVLLKGIEEGGFLFYTNYQSQKGQELSSHPFAALTFLWHELQRQVRIEGRAEKLSPEASTRYFQSRPKGSQIGAWVSPQSQPIESRKVLEERERELWSQYEGAEQLPRPEHWGGYRVIPHRIEFWQGRPSRLHDRVLYESAAAGRWQKSRLAP